jgi:hypothetical protein
MLWRIFASGSLICLISVVLVWIAVLDEVDWWPERGTPPPLAQWGVYGLPTAVVLRALAALIGIWEGRHR